MIEAVYKAYAATALSHAIRKSDWAFAVIEMVHLVALAVLGGAVLIGAAGLISNRFAFAGQGSLWRGTRTTALYALAATILSGVLLVGSNPLKYYFNPAFNAKLWLLLAGIAVAAALDWLLRRQGRRRWQIAILALLLSLLWFSVALAGRAIGLL